MDAKNFEKYLKSKFWFKNLKRILWNGEPIRLKSKEYREKYPNITLRSLNVFSSKDFESLKDEDKKVEALGMPINSVKSYITKDYENAFWNLNGGIGTFRLLGQEFARDMAIQNYIDASGARRNSMLSTDEGKMLEQARLSRKKTEFLTAGRAMSDLDPDKALVKGVKEAASVGDLIKLISAERMTYDPALLLSLVPETKIDKSKLSKFASPILTANGENYYDPALLTDNNAKQIPTLFDGTKEFVLGKDLKLVTVEAGEFDEFMTNLQKNIKIKLIGNSDLEAGTVAVNDRSMFRNAGRIALDKVKYRINRRKNAVEKSYEVQYSTKGTKDEQIYSVLKHMGSLVCDKSFEDLEKQFGVSGVMGVPSADEYQKIFSLIKDAAASLAAVQLAAGFLPRRSDNNILGELFRVDAMKTLAKIEKDNTWVAGILGAVLSNSLNNAFANGKVIDGIYETNTYSKWEKTKSFLSTMFSKKKYREFEGVLTQMSPITKAQLDAKFGPKNKFDINALTKEQENTLKILVGQHLQQMFEKTTNRDYLKYLELDKKIQEVEEKIRKVGGYSSSEGLKIYEDNLDLRNEYNKFDLKTRIYYAGVSNDKYNEKYPEIFEELQQQEVEEVVAHIKANPKLSEEELETAITQSLEDETINKNTQDRIDTATLWLGGYQKHEQEGLMFDMLSRTYDETKALAKTIEEDKAILTDQNFKEKLEEYKARKNVSADVKKEIEQKLTDLNLVQNYYAFINYGEQLGAKEYGEILDSVREEYSQKISDYLKRVENVFEQKDYGNAFEAEELQKEILSRKDFVPVEYLSTSIGLHIQDQKEIIEKFNALKSFVENIPEKGLNLESKETKDELKALILSDVLKAVKEEKAEISQIIKDNENNKDYVYVNKLGKLTVEQYQTVEKKLNKDAQVLDDVNKFAESILLVMKNEDYQTTEELYKAYKDRAQKESLPTNEFINEKIDYRVDLSAAYLFAIDFEDVVSRAVETNKQNTQTLNKNFKKMQSINKVMNELVENGLSKEDEAFKSLSEEFARLAQVEIRSRQLHDAQKDIVLRWDDCITAIKVAKPNFEDEEEKKKLDESVYYLTQNQNIEKIDLIDFSKIEQLANNAQEALAQLQRNKQFERKERDWTKIAKIVKSAQQKGLNLEGTIKAIEEYKSPKAKEQTEEDKENIKEFFGVLGYMAKLGDKVFEKEQAKLSIIELDEKEREKLSEKSVQEFENLKNWLHIENNFDGINTLSDKLHEYGMRQGETSKNATEIYGIYFDLASKIIETAAKDIENTKTKSGNEISRYNIKLKSVNERKEVLAGSKVREKKLKKFMPKLDQEKIRAEKSKKAEIIRAKKLELARQKREELKKANEISYEEIILSEILKTFNDYAYVDRNAENTLKVLKEMLKQEIIPAKVGEDEKILATKLVSKMAPEDKAKLEKVKNVLIEAIKHDADECRSIEENIKSSKNLSGELKQLKASIVNLAKKTELKNTIANFIRVDKNTPKDVKQIVEQAQKENAKNHRAKEFEVKNMIVNHSNMEQIFDLTVNLLDELLKQSLTRTRMEKDADMLVLEMQNRKSGKEKGPRHENRQEEKRQKTRNFFMNVANSEKGEGGNKNAQNDEILL